MLRQLNECKQYKLLAANGQLLTASSSAEIASDKAARNMAKRLRLPFQRFPATLSLRLDDKLNLRSGFREKPRQAKALSDKQLNRVAAELGLRLTTNEGKK